MKKTHEHSLDLLQNQLDRYFRERLAALSSETARVEGERTAALEAVGQLRRLFAGAGVATRPYVDEPPVLSLTDAATRVITDFIVGDFNINTVIDLVTRHYPEIKRPINPTSVSGILRSLQKEGTLELVRHGAGPRPSVYRLRTRK